MTPSNPSIPTQPTTPNATQINFRNLPQGASEGLVGGMLGGMLDSTGGAVPSGTGNSDPNAPVKDGILGTVPIAGFNADQAAAQDMTRNRALGGDPTIGLAQGYVQQSLNGGFANPDANPYLKATFDNAAMATQGQLASQFAGSGRNVEQSQGLRAQQLNDLATSIYGGNYANERNLTQQALGYAQPLGNQSYADIAALNQSGGYQQNQQQQVLDAPATALDQYLARVRGTDYGSTQTQKNPSNPVGGALGGAAAGSVFGPYGALIGGGLGAIFG